MVGVGEANPNFLNPKDALLRLGAPLDCMSRWYAHPQTGVRVCLSGVLFPRVDPGSC